MSKRAKWSVVGLFVAGVAGLGVVTAARRGDKPVEVRIEPVEARDLVASVTASGQVQPRSKVDVAADISGRIVRLAVKEGAMVSKGQFLLQIDPDQYEAAVQRTEAALASARAQEAQAKANLLQSQRGYERSAEIKKNNPALVSDEQLEQLRTQVEVNQALYDAAKYSVQQSAAALRDARTQLGRSTIMAPMSGRVTRLNVEQGETAVPGTFNKEAATLLTISDMSVLETKVKVDETDVARISVGDSAEVQIDAFPDTTFVGRVVEISNSSLKTAAAVGGQQGDQAVDYEVTIQLVNQPADTRPDFSATAKVVTDTRQKALSIPIIALTVREDERIEDSDTAVTLGRTGPTPAKQVGKRDVEGVFVVGKDNRVTFRPVKVGIAGEKYFEVLSGLRPGERIVAGTYQAIRELKDSTLVREPKEKDKDKEKKAGAEAKA
jgi:HlyD family secretion protein